MKPVILLGICGSLRANSSNRALLEVAATLVPAGVTLSICEMIGTLPLFRPDQPEPAPTAVLRFREALAAADAVITASPEYAHGITGGLKNALDWVVASGEFSEKPVAVPNTSPSSRHAHEALVEILTTMDARVVPEASSRIPLPSMRTTRDEIAADAGLCGSIRSMLEAIVAAIPCQDRQTCRPIPKGLE